MVKDPHNRWRRHHEVRDSDLQQSQEPCALERFFPIGEGGGFRAYELLTAELAASGELLAAEALADPSAGKRLEATDRKVLITDGPFAEGKEHLAGFFLIQCDSFDRATAIAARVPEADLGLVEVRPTMDLSAFET